MKRTPSYLFRAMDVMVAGDDKIGQVAEFEIPEIKHKTEKVWNAGMIKEREITLGHEVGNTTFKMTAYDPATLSLYGIGIGPDTEIVLTKALADEDGVMHRAFIRARGHLSMLKSDKVEMGKKHSSDYEFTTNYLYVEVDGTAILEVDDFTLRVNGNDLYAGINQALGRQ
jgi:P2 family phage contractile tail tube protein